MTPAQVLETVTNELCTKYGCHTVILYGSRARGDATEASDYDIIGVRDKGETLRDARLWNGVYLDIFVYAKNELDDPHSGMLDMRHGKVLREKDDTAKKFFAKLESMDAKGPNKLRADEIAALRSWHLKALETDSFRWYSRTPSPRRTDAGNARAPLHHSRWNGIEVRRRAFYGSKRINPISTRSLNEPLSRQLPSKLSRNSCLR